MTTNNQVNVPLLGSTGTGNFVGANTPTLITPILGAATATSINFGGSTLSNYANGNFTPTMTFSTPGNLSVLYAQQFGAYTRIGNIVFYAIILTATPTFTTASGTFQITALPITIGALANGSSSNLSGIIYPAGATMLTPAASDSVNAIVVYGSGTATQGAFLTTANFTTTTIFSISVSGFYFA